MRTLLRPGLALALVAGAAAPAAAQLDPLLFLRTTQHNVILAVDAANRMQRDANNDYYDQQLYPVTGALYEPVIGVTPLTATTTYYRKYVGLAHLNPSTSGGDKFRATRITTVGNLEAGHATFFEATRLALARRALVKAVTDNQRAVRFGLIKMRQSSPTLGTLGNEGPVFNDDATQATPTDLSNGKWKITRPTVAASNSSVAASGLLVAADAANQNTTIVTTLNRDLGTAGAIIPAGADALNTIDAPVGKMLDDARAEAARLIAADTACRNTVVVLVVGGADGTITNEDLATKAATFLNVSGRRVPIYVVAIAPPAGDVDALRAVATTSGGQYFEITAAMIAATTPGQPVPELVRAVNTAVQHTFAAPTDFDTAPTVALPYGPQTEHQVTSPVIGTVNLRDAVDITGAALPDTFITTATGTEIPQRSNVMVTTGLAVPGFEARLRAFRVYRPVADSTKPSGYRFDQSGARLWVARAPAAASRNIFTVLPDGTMIPFDTTRVADLTPYLGVSDPATLIDWIRSQPLGAVVGSTPAFADPPSLDPPPDEDYPAFREDNKDRRSTIFVGANDGMLHAIDGRLGVESWAFIPFNLLPKLKTLRSGQPVDAFNYFVDSSPKVSDVKVGGVWRTYLFVGQGPGGTFYNAFDVTMDGMADAVAPTSDSEAAVLGYFAAGDKITFEWSFPRLTSFDHTIAPYGDVAASATAAEKSVGETWSDPAIGQIVDEDGPFAMFVGSGFLSHTRQQQANRGGARAGTTFYILDVGDGTVHASRDVGSDNVAETVDDCRTSAAGCDEIKNALQMDPVATGPADSRFVTRVYIGDLDGRVWRFDVGVSGSSGTLSVPTQLYNAGAAHPLFSSMATVNVGGSQQYLFVGTGSDLLPSNGVAQSYSLLVLLDQGASATKTSEILLVRTDGAATESPVGGDEKITAFPAVAGDIVFFTTTTMTLNPCSPFIANLYAFTFVGGPAYDTNGDGRLTSSTSSSGGGGKKGGGGSTSADSTRVFSTSGARATAPFIVDQHLVFASGGQIQMFGDPQDFNNGVGQAGVRILSWRHIR
ncbi:MAG: PilC/PilY family type IV pilus protein [Acidobacteriota bacterium]